jgi:hypothetical protein
VRKRLDRVDKNASRLLKSLGVNDPDEAPTLHLPGIATNDYPPCHYMNRGIHSRVLLRARW